MLAANSPTTCLSIPFTTTVVLLGTSTVTSFVESSAGIAVGGRTGLTAVVTGLLFVLSMFFDLMYQI